MEDFENLTAFLEHVALVMENEASEATEKVMIMTLHGAKGLEFDHVFLVGWEEGVFPSQRSLDEGGNASLEEERRLAYVGITRARQSATILHAANRRVYGQWTSSIPSRFIAELPEDAIKSSDTLSGGPSLWRAALGQADPFADVARGTGRGPGWQRAATAEPYSGALGGRGRSVTRAAPVETRASAVSFAQPARKDVRVGTRVFHSKFGYGAVTAIDGNKLEIEFEKAGSKRVLDSFIEVVGN
jgi:DNA helicase-2/ATP-dependent DNA helicase PcrA